MRAKRAKALRRQVAAAGLSDGGERVVRHVRPATLPDGRELDVATGTETVEAGDHRRTYQELKRP